MAVNYADDETRLMARTIKLCGMVINNPAAPDENKAAASSVMLWIEQNYGVDQINVARTMAKHMDGHNG